MRAWSRACFGNSAAKLQEVAYWQRLIAGSEEDIERNEREVARLTAADPVATAQVVHDYQAAIARSLKLVAEYERIIESLTTPERS